MMEKKLDEAQEDFIVALYFHEQYNSHRCWRTVEVAQQEYSGIGSQAAKLRAVKEQILRLIIHGPGLDTHLILMNCSII